MKLTDRVNGKIHLISCAVLFVLAWVFWAFVHPEELSYQEESQLFVYDSEYFALHWWHGLPSMLSAFLVQFYNNVLVGAVIIAAIYVLLFHFGWRVCKRWLTDDYKHYLGIVIFVLAIWLIMALTNAKLTCVLFVTLGLIITDIFGHKIFCKEDGNIKGAYKVLYFIVLCVFALYHDGYTDIFKSANWNMLKYDYKTRLQDWEGIMEKSKNNDTRNHVSNALINLAFGMKGSLSSRGDEKGNRGIENAFPKYDGKFLTGVALSEVYYYLGYVNTANLYAHKANETLGKGNQSARMLKRIIETDIINGNYDDARKYLEVLQKTIYYKRWADKNLALLGNEDAINRNKFYGYERRVRIPNDTIKKGQKMDEVILALIKQNNENYLAIQYYLLIPQLEHNEKKYDMYLNYVEKKMK